MLAVSDLAGSWLGGRADGGGLISDWIGNAGVNVTLLEPL